VGDPLTPGGGPGRAELRLEEEEEVKEEPKETEEAKRAEEVSEAPLSTTGGWELFGHLLIEDLQVLGRISVMRCVRCGASAPLTDLKALKETPCITEKAENTEKREAVVSLPSKKCENCGREATASLCDQCAIAFEEYALVARPAPLRGRGGIKPPSVSGVDGWGWVSSLTTFFPFRKTPEGGREWWCPVPGCKRTARRLVDIADHFHEAHVTLASRGWYEEFDAHSRRVRIRTWQGWVNEDTMELVLELGVTRP
jgi:ferredoxin